MHIHMSIEKMMVVEGHDDQEVVGCHDQDYAQLVIKGKRTKRQRPHSPLNLAMVSSSGSAAESGGEIGERFSSDNINYNSVGGGGGGGGSLDHRHHDGGMQGAGSPSSSVDFATSSEEEEDMANCLILLAQGHSNCKPKACAEAEVHVQANNKGATAGAAGLYVYECKTCNRCFPSFQALGGHRASHKKPKPNGNNTDEKKANSIIMEEEDHHHYTNMNMSTTLSLQTATNRTALYANATSNNVVKANKVHECSICGAEFSSGQALGGHMRRHRASATTTAPPTTALSMATTRSTLHQSPEPKKPRNNDLLELDLNLPAPEEESKFGFSSKEQVIIFSASSLVDCHY